MAENIIDLIVGILVAVILGAALLQSAETPLKVGGILVLLLAFGIVWKRIKS